MALVTYVSEESKEPDVQTGSNSTLEPETDVVKMSDNQHTAKLLQHLTARRPVTVNAKLLTLDDVRSIISADFHNADECWKLSAPKKTVSR